MVNLSIQDAVKKFDSLPKSIQQALIGSASGWMTGYTLGKFGRYAGFCVGASILIIQLGSHYGYINVDWKSVNRDLKRAQGDVEERASAHLPDLSARIQSAFKDNLVPATSFLGGVMVGASMA